MSPLLRSLTALIVLAGSAVGEGDDDPPPTWRQRLEQFWRAEEVATRHAAARAVVRAHPPVDSLVAALRTGRAYREDVPTGRLTWSWYDDLGREHLARVYVPEDYDPTRRHAVHVFLHGNVNRDRPRHDDLWWARPRRLAGPGRILVFPAGWAEARWWQTVKVEHLAALLARLRRSYHIDENRCVLGGVSDGGTGTWYQALRAPESWSAFLPFIGHPSVLNDPGESSDGEVHPVNVGHESFFVISGRGDPKYPTFSLRPYLELFRAAGAEIVHRPHEGGHDVRNWAAQWRAIEDFLATHPRRPDPDHVSWRTDDVIGAPGAYAVRIDELGPTPHDSEFPRYSVITDSSGGTPRRLLAFRRDRPAGQVELRREGGTWRLRTENVRRLRLLVTVARIEDSPPIRLVHGGRVLFEGPLGVDVPTLMRWAARLDDRTRLIGAEIVVEPAAGRAWIVSGPGDRGP